MVARRTPRQIAFDSWAEVRDFMPEVIELVRLFGGRSMHPNRAQVRAGQMITPTSCPWPDLSVWFPEADFGTAAEPRFHLVELKSHIHPKPREGQPEVFASLDAAGQTVNVWEPRQLDDLIPSTLEAWSGRPRPALRYPAGLFVPRSRKLGTLLKQAG